MKYTFNQIKEGKLSVKIILSYKTEEEKVREPILYLAKSKLQNGRIGIFVVRNFKKNDLITCFVRVKTKEQDRYTLEVTNNDRIDCMLSILIKGNKKENRVGSAFFLGGHSFNDKRFRESKKS